MGRSSVWAGASLNIAFAYLPILEQRTGSLIQSVDLISLLLLTFPSQVVSTCSELALGHHRDKGIPSNEQNFAPQGVPFLVLEQDVSRPTPKFTTAQRTGQWSFWWRKGLERIAPN